MGLCIKFESHTAFQMVLSKGWLPVRAKAHEHDLCRVCENNLLNDLSPVFLTARPDLIPDYEWGSAVSISRSRTN